jgi:hypothetical protein
MGAIERANVEASMRWSELGSLAKNPLAVLRRHLKLNGGEPDKASGGD